MCLGPSWRGGQHWFGWADFSAPRARKPVCCSHQPASVNRTSLLTAIPDGHYRRGVCHPQWLLLLVAALGTLTGSRSSRYLVTFANQHREVPNHALGLNFKRWLSDASFLDVFNNPHLQEFGQVLQAWIINQMPGGADGLDQLMCCTGLPRSGWPTTARLGHRDRGWQPPQPDLGPAVRLPPDHCDEHAAAGRLVYDTAGLREWDGALQGMPALRAVARRACSAGSHL